MVGPLPAGFSVICATACEHFIPGFYFWRIIPGPILPIGVSLDQETALITVINQLYINKINGIYNVFYCRLPTTKSQY